MQETRWVLDRRDFLKAGAAALAGLALGCRSWKLPHYDAPGIRFALLNDPHYADAPPVKTRFYRDSLSKMQEAVTQLRTERPAFLLENGDFKDCIALEPEERTLSYLSTIETEFQKFGGPAYHTLGNHDMDNISKEQYFSRVRNNGAMPDRGFYAFSNGGIRFVVLDACFKADGNPYKKGNFKSSEALIPADQLQWLRGELRRSAQPVIVFVHQRLDGVGSVYVQNAPEVRKVLEGSGNVLAVFHGHDHPGGYTLIGGIHYYTLKAMVEGAGLENNSFAIVEVHPSLDITVAGYRKAVSMTMNHQVPVPAA